MIEIRIILTLLLLLMELNLLIIYKQLIELSLLVVEDSSITFSCNATTDSSITLVNNALPLGKVFSLLYSFFCFANLIMSNKTILLERELEKWKTYSDVLRKTERDLFNQMLQSVYKYSNSIEAKGENYATESLLMSLLFEQHKLLSKTNQQNCLKY